MKLIKLIIGDWSHDGHNLTETKTFTSNLSAKEIEAAYFAGCEKIGGNIADYINDYEATTVPLKLVKKIEAAWHERNPGKTEDDFLDAMEFDGGYDTLDYKESPYTGKYDPQYDSKYKGERFKPLEEYTDFVSIHCDCYFQLYLEVVRMGNPSFVMKNSSEKAEVIHAGGYGLLSN